MLNGIFHFARFQALRTSGECRGRSELKLVGFSFCTQATAVQNCSFTFVASSPLICCLCCSSSALSNVEKKKKLLKRLEEQLAKLNVQATDKEENKQIALGTSKLNYLDPRISIAWYVLGILWSKWSFGDVQIN